jgi:hypothetical protein
MIRRLLWATAIAVALLVSGVTAGALIPRGELGYVWGVLACCEQVCYERDVWFDEPCISARRRHWQDGWVCGFNDTSWLLGHYQSYGPDRPYLEWGTPEPEDAAPQEE